MIRLDAVRARIEARAPALAGRMGTAGEFADLVDNDQVPQITPAGFALLGGIEGGAADAAAGLYRQAFVESVMVVLCDRYAGDASGGAAMDAITPLVREVVLGVVGWGPDDAPGVFVLRHAELVGIKKGALIFQIEFALQDQLRVNPT